MLVPGVMWVYLLLSNVLLSNLLIAMFADTFTSVKENAENEYHFRHYRHVFDYIHTHHTLPPPLGAPLIAPAVCSNTPGARRQYFMAELEPLQAS